MVPAGSACGTGVGKGVGVSYEGTCPGHSHSLALHCDLFLQSATPPPSSTLHCSPPG